jgi:tetratricopeptide (TPR) repeat protein
MEDKLSMVACPRNVESTGEYDFVLKRKNRNDFEASINRGRGYHAERIYDKAIDDYICALSMLGLEYGKIDMDIIKLQIEKYNQNYKSDEKLSLISISDLYNFIGLSFRCMGDYNGALLNYNNAITIYPENPPVYNNIGCAYLDLKKNELAIENFNIAIQYYKEYAVAYNNRGNAKSRVGRRKEAEEDYIEAAKHDDKCEHPWYNLRTLFFEDNRNKEAIKAYKRAVKIDKDFALAYFYMGEVYLKLGKYLRANYYIRKACKLEPDNPIIRKALSGK